MSLYRNKIIQEDIDEIIASVSCWERLKNKTVLLTGATGMLPSYMAFTILRLNELRNYNMKLILIVRDIKKFVHFYGNDFFSNANVVLKKIDLTKPFDINEHIDFIIHGASVASSHMYLTNPVEVSLPNMLATYILLELARKNNVESFLYFSSGAVYGKIEGKNVISENDSGYLNPLDIRSCYGTSKRMAENLCVAYASEYNVNVKSVRLAHTFGPTLDLSDSRVFSEFTRNILNGQNIEIKSDGNAVRTFCYISDATTAFWKVLFDGAKGAAYNICNNDNFISIKELADKLLELFPDKKLKTVFVKRSASDNYAEDKNANVVKYDDSRIRALGWTPNVDVLTAFRRTVKSFLL